MKFQNFGFIICISSLLNLSPKCLHSTNYYETFWTNPYKHAKIIMVSDIVEFSYKVYCILEKRKKRKKKREYVHSKALFLGGGEI